MNQTIIKIGSEKYINVDRITHVESKRNGKMIVYFAAGGGDCGGAHCKVTLNETEAREFQYWLDQNCRT